MLAGNNANGLLTHKGKLSSSVKNKLLKEALQKLAGKTAVAYNPLQLYSHDTAKLSFDAIPNISYLETPNSDLSTQTRYDYRKSMALIEKLSVDNPLVDNLVVVSTSPLCVEMPNMLTEKYLQQTFEYEPITEEQLLIVDFSAKHPIIIFSPSSEAVEA